MLWEKLDKEGDAEETPLTVDEATLSSERSLVSQEKSTQKNCRQTWACLLVPAAQHQAPHAWSNLPCFDVFVGFVWGLGFFWQQQQHYTLPKCHWPVPVKNVTASSQLFNRDTTASITVEPCTTTTFHCTVSSLKMTLRNAARVRKHFTKLRQRPMQAGFQTLLSLLLQLRIKLHLNTHSTREPNL